MRRRWRWIRSAIRTPGDHTKDATRATLAVVAAATCLGDVNLSFHEPAVTLVTPQHVVRPAQFGRSARVAPTLDPFAILGSEAMISDHTDSCRTRFVEHVRPLREQPCGRRDSGMRTGMWPSPPVKW